MIKIYAPLPTHLHACAEVLSSLKSLFIRIAVVTMPVYGVGTGALPALVLRSAYCIVEYGCILQTEVDETD